MRRRAVRVIGIVGFLGVLAAAFASIAAGLRFDDQSYLTPQGVVGSPYTHRFSAPPPGTGGAGCDPPYFFRVDSGSLPPGLSLDTRSGVIGGIPTQAGSWSFWASIKDDPTDKSWCNPMSAEREFTIRVIDRLVIGPESAAPGTVGVGYSLPMTATLSEPKTWSISQGALPPGLTLGSSSGVITGTPTAAGSYSFTVLAVVDPKRSDTKALTIVVRDPLAVGSEAPFDAGVARGEVGASFRATLAVTGGSGTYAWSLGSGALPPGLTLANGAISGKPSASGVYSFVAAVTDTEGRVANYSGRISVAERLAISTLRILPGRVGRRYRARLAISGGVKPMTWRIVRGSLPRGVRFDRTLGLLSGMPARRGAYRVVFEATDSLGVRAKRTLTIVVAPKPKLRSS